MALSPKDAKVLTSPQEAEVKIIEAQIDKILMEEHREFEMSTYSEKVKNRVLELYRGNGWDVTCTGTKNVFTLKFEERAPYYGGRD